MGLQSWSLPGGQQQQPLGTEARSGSGVDAVGTWVERIWVRLRFPRCFRRLQGHAHKIRTLLLKYKDSSQSFA